MRVLKFFVTGLIGISVNLGVFRLCYQLGLPYLEGSIIAFLCALIVGFFLQKYWTFQDRISEDAQRQFLLYATLALCNLGINTLVVYMLIRYASVYYLVAQTMGAALVAFVSYFLYRSYIFANRLETHKTIAEHLEAHL